MGSNPRYILESFLLYHRYLNLVLGCQSLFSPKISSQIKPALFETFENRDMFQTKKIVFAKRQSWLVIKKLEKVLKEFLEEFFSSVYQCFLNSNLLNYKSITVSRKSNITSICPFRSRLKI